MNNKTLLTKAGYQKLRQELTELKLKREHIITQIEDVAQPDETGEDGLVTQLKEELEVVNDKITKLDEALENSEIISGNGKSNIISVGSRVKVRLTGSKELEFCIVSEFEADPNQNKISDQSPLGLALLGKSLHDQIEVEAPVGKITYKIVSIS